MFTVTIVFYLSAGVLLYTLFGYPLLTLALAAIVDRRIDKRSIAPSVTFLIAAYNEADVIAQKLDQTLALDYPPEKLQVIVASDGSTDGTDDIVHGFADRGVVLYRAEGRKGKTQTLNEAIANCATGEILVFSDATGVYNTEAIRELVSNFNDPTIGCVTGRVVYSYGDDSNSRGFRFYQRLARAVRRAESRFGSQTSVSGSIHAMRRELFEPGRPEFSLDVIDAVHTAIRGYRVVYEYAAQSLETSRTSMGSEFRCRVRISVRGVSMIPYVVSKLVAARKWSYLFQMTSHKFLRWWMWFFLFLALITNVVLASSSSQFAWLLVVQAGFYILGILGILASCMKVSVPFASGAAFFLVGNAAMCAGALKRLWGASMPSWEPIR